ncbi:MAG TPA: phage portal protein [Gemmatimonadales bacterium]|jgi:lambda family phage portal protein
MSGVSIVRSGAPQPNALERVIEFVSPAWAARRMNARLFNGFAGQYIGARLDRRQTMDFTPRALSPNSDTLGDLPGRGGLRARARDLERNEPLAKGAADSTITAVIGPGLLPAPNIDSDLLGLTDEAADEWEANALRLWRAHAGNCCIDYAAQGSIDEMSEQAFWGEFVNGDILAVRRYVDAPGRLFGLAVQLIEADRICNPQFEILPDTMGGVKFDVATGEPLGYWVCSIYPEDRLQRPYAAESWSYIPKRGPDGELQATLIMRSRRPGLLRGVTAFAPVIEPLRKLGNYSNAELTAAVISAFFTVFVKRKAVGDPDSPTPFFSADAIATQGRADNPRTKAPDLKLGEGAIASLDDGEDITIANPSRPNAQFDPFWLAMVRQIGIALEIPYEVLIKHFSSSYSASRAALLEAWRVYLVRRARFVRLWYAPIWEWLITEAVAREYLSAPGFFDDPLRRAAWLGVQWSGPTMPQVDELKAANAATERMTSTLTTLEEEKMALNGRSWMSDFGQVKKERRMLTDAGIPAPQNTVTTRDTETVPVTAPENQ